MAKQSFLGLLWISLLMLVGSLPLSAQTDRFQIAYGDTVSDGVPGPGAGNIEGVGAQDSYSFDGTAGDEAIFDSVVGNIGIFGWRLVAPDGTVLVDSFNVDRRLSLPVTGSYTFTVRGFQANTTGVYSFRLLLVPPPQMFAANIGDVISDGVPAVGAGNLEAPGAVDLYTFDGIAGGGVIFDALVGNTGLARVILTAPDGTELMSGFYQDQQAVFSQSGTYTLRVEGLTLTSTGVYSFQLLSIATPQIFAISIGDSISDGVPAPGAGNLETPGAVDLYSFDGAATQMIIFDALVGNTGQFRVTLTAPDGADVFDHFYQDNQVTLPQTGSYSLRVSGSHPTQFGTYAFQLLNVPPAAQEFAISLGDTVSDGVPAPGAGNLEVPGAVDSYAFDAVAAQAIIFDALVGNTGQFRVTVTAPNGTELFDDFYQDRQVTLPQTGSYRLTVSGGQPTLFGTYAFQLLSVPPAAQVFTINISDTISDGVPAPGAGNLEVPGAVDIYRFNGAAGQNVMFDALTGNTGQFRILLTAPDGTELFDDFYQDQQVTLPQAGVYSLTVHGLLVTDFGVYSFMLLEVLNSSPIAADDTTTTDEDLAVNIGVLSNDIDADGDPLSIFSVTQSVNGAVINNGTDVTYTPNPNFHGTDSFTYTVSDGNGGSDTAAVMVTVNAVNDGPMATDDTATTDEDVPVSISVLSNDTDVDGDTLVVESVNQPANGTVINNATDVTYTPSANFNGTDAFTYIIHDGNGGTDTATVVMTINLVNDDPVAGDDSSAINENTPVTVDVLANDSDVDGDTLVVESVTQPANGTVTNNGTDVTYSPSANFNEIDSFTYIIHDGNGGTDSATVTVSVNSVNTAPLACDDSVTIDEDASVTIDVLANDMDDDGDALTVQSVTPPANGTVTNNGTDVTYTPNPNFYGTDTFTYTIDDGNGGVSTATVTVTVNPVNDAPMLNDAAFDIAENSPIGTPIGTLTASDDDGTTFTFAVTSGNIANAFAIDSGTGAISVSGVLDHESNPVYTLVVTVTDHGTPALSDTATIIITVLDADEIRPTADIVDVTPDPRDTPVHSITITFSEGVTGFDIGDLTLTRDGALVPLTGAALNGSAQRYTLDPLDLVTTAPGLYVLTLAATGSGIVDTAGNGLVGDTSDTWVVTGTTAPTVLSSLRADADPTSAQRVNFTVTFNAAVLGVDTTDFTLTTTGGILGASVSVVRGGASTYTVTVDTGSGDGTLRLDVLNDGTITDPSGSALTGGTFTTGEAYTVIKSAPVDISTPSPLPPPPAPTCDQANFDEHSGVRTGIAETLRYAIHCRVLYWNGQTTTWLGGALYGEANLGIPGLHDLGVEQAVDIFSPSGMHYFDGGAVFCLRGEGTLIWLAAKNAPRIAEIIGSYSVEDFPGFTCATLFEPGTLILVRDNPVD